MTIILDCGAATIRVAAIIQAMAINHSNTVLTLIQTTQFHNNNLMTWEANIPLSYVGIGLQGTVTSLCEALHNPPVGY